MANEVSLEFPSGETVVTDLGGDLDITLLIDRLAFSGNSNSPDLAVLLALATEVQAARNGRPSLAHRLATISNFASPNVGGYMKGQYTDNALHAAPPSTITGVAGHCVMAPYYTSNPLTIDEMGVAVTTAVAGATGRCFIYAAGPDDWPLDLIHEPLDNLDLSTTGYKGHSLAGSPITFEPGRMYWVGFRSFSTAAIRAVPTTSVPNLGITSAGTQYFTALRRTVPETFRLPPQWAFVPSDRATNTAPPSIRMRIA